MSVYDADVLTKDKPLAQYYEKALSFVNPSAGKILANWITTELLGRLNSENLNISQAPVSCENMAELVKLIENNTISGKIAKTVFAEMFTSGKMPSVIVKEKNLVQITDETEIKKIVEQVISENQKAADEYKAGKKQALGSLVGAVMKKTEGKANPQTVNKLLQELLKTEGGGD